jgi:MFS family permease
MIGGQMQQVAIAWQLYNLTNSPFQVGLVSFFGIVPFLFLSFVGGALADRFDRKRILLTTQFMTMTVAAVLTTATITGQVSPALIYAISFISGMTRAFDSPARQALIPNLVPPDELANALTLNTMLRQLATVAGPGLGGLILGFFGLSVTYAINTLSFVSIIGALLIMDPLPPIKRTTESGLHLALGGLRFVRSEPVVLSILALDFFTTLFGSIRALLPVFARDILDVGPEGLGLLFAAPAIGAVTGAMILGAVGTRWLHPVFMIGTSALFGLFTIGFGLSTFMPLSLVMLFGTGFVDVIGEVLRATVVQLRTPDALRGRVTALTVIFSNGGPQLGQVQSGGLGSLVGPVEAAVVGGAGVLICAAAFCFNPHLRRPIPPRQDALAHTQPAPTSAG